MILKLIRSFTFVKELFLEQVSKVCKSVNRAKALESKVIVTQNGSACFHLQNKSVLIN